MPNLFKRTGGWSWVPDADAIGAPDGALLRATNTIPDAAGARVLRRGSADVYSGAGLNVRTVFSPILQDVKYRFAGADDEVYGGPANATSLPQLGSNFDGHGDISFGEDAYQAFFARGSVKKKYDGESYHNWGIAAPPVKPIVQAVNAITSTVASFDGASHGTPESPAFTVNEGAGAEVDGYAASGSEAYGALQLTPSASPGPGSVASATKKWTTNQDFLDLKGSTGSHTDLFDMRVAMDNPKKVDKIRVMFGLNTGDDPFADDYYYYDFNIKDNGGEVNLKDPDTNAVAAYNAATERLLSSLTSSQLTDVRSPEAAGAIVKKLTSLRGDKSQSRTDSVGASPAWGHFTVTRGQFSRAGKTSGRNWKTVRGFKIIYNVVSGDTTTAMRFDDATWIGGGTRSLSGTFRVGYRYARRLLDKKANEIYTELSPMSPVSDEINLAQQSLSITIPEVGLTSKDPQVDTVWVYLYGGWLDTYYRVAIISAAPSIGMTIDELANPDGPTTPGGSDYFGDATERVRLTSHGFTFVQNTAPIKAAATSPVVSSITRSGTAETVTTSTSPAITSITSSSGVATVVLDGAHGWSNGDYVRVNGVTEGAYNKTASISVIDTVTFTYAISTAEAATATIGEDTTITRMAIAEVTTSSAHGWVTNDYVQVQGIPEAGYNAVAQITVTSSTVFTYPIEVTATTPATITNVVITYMNALLGTPTDPGDQSITLALNKSELDALLENEPFEPGAGRPPNNIIGIAGPWRKRQFALTAEGWLYVSSDKRPSSFSVYHAMDLRMYGTPYWVIEAGEHIYVGCSRDVIRIAGSGEIDETGVLLDLYPQEIGAANPPTDGSAATDGNAIIYRSGDGPMMLNGATLTPIPFAGTSFLWKGRSRHGITALDTANGRFRFEVDNHNLYMLAPEGTEYLARVWYFSQTGTTVTATFEASHNFLDGDEIIVDGASTKAHNGTFYVTKESDTTISYKVTDVEEIAAPGAPDSGTAAGYARAITQPSKVWKFMPSHQQWCRFDYGHNVLCIWREFNGKLVVGTDDGRVREIETGLQDGTSNINVDILTPFDDGGNPFGRKVAADVQFHVDTNNLPGLASFYVDGQPSPTALVPFTTSKETVYRSGLTSLGVFLKLQVGITGAFNEFSLSSFGVSYTPRPQQFMVLDTGHIALGDGGDIAWVTHAYLDCFSPADLQLKIYKNGTLHGTCDIPVTANERDEYTIVMPRGTKGRRLRFVLVTTNSAGEGDVGFEPYSLRVKNAVSGKKTELPFNRGDQGND